MKLEHALQLEPQYREYVWGGQRLRPGVLTAEAWIVYEQDKIATGPLAGRTLADLAAEHGAELLGQRVVTRFGERLPLLIKLLDCAEWLSLQVHPNEEQAARLEGPDKFGKTEAWYVLDAASEAQLIAGLKPGTTADALAESIRNGTILDWVQYLPVYTGDTVLLNAGTIHALGPGLLIYEVQQTSDITYRVFDWNRPQTAGRVLHIDKSLAVADPHATAQAKPSPALGDGERQVLVKSPYFTLELLAGRKRAFNLDTRGESFHALTVIDGSAEIITAGNGITLNRFESALVPAAGGAYRILPLGHFQILKSSVE